MKKNDEYNSAIDEEVMQRVHFIFTDILEELDNIERHLDTESSKILMHWVRDAILRVQDSVNNPF